MVESDMWEKKEDLGNTKELVNKFKERLGTEVRRQEGVVKRENPERDKYKRIELLERYTEKQLYG